MHVNAVTLTAVMAVQSVREYSICEERSGEAISNILVTNEIGALRSQIRKLILYSRMV